MVICWWELVGVAQSFRRITRDQVFVDREFSDYVLILHEQK